MSYCTPYSGPKKKPHKAVLVVKLRKYKYIPGRPTEVRPPATYFQVCVYAYFVASTSFDMFPVLAAEWYDTREYR